MMLKIWENQFWKGIVRRNFGAKTLKPSMLQCPNVSWFCLATSSIHLQASSRHYTPPVPLLRYHQIFLPAKIDRKRSLLDVCEPGRCLFRSLILNLFWHMGPQHHHRPNTFLIGMTKSNFAEEKQTYHYHHRACFCLQQHRHDEISPIAPWRLFVENNSFWDFPNYPAAN